MSSRIRIRHETVYRFDKPAAFGVWRLMMRPVDTHALRVVEATLELSPAGETQWSLDAYGNCVCRFQPQGEAAELRVVNHLVVDRFPAPLTFDDPKSPAPIAYAPHDRMVLAPYTWPDFQGEDGRFGAWVDAHAPIIGEPALGYVRRLTSVIAREFDYARRESEGTQTPEQTVRRGAGACRDLAWLMIETLRRFGFAARFASGYLYAPEAAARGAGATHAWCEVFLPELGWLEFDPTNGIIESADLIRVAATRTPEEAAPMAGATATPAQAELSVSVDVSLV